MQNIWAATPVIIVSYRTPRDVAACLASLDAMEPEPESSVHICENGGAEAFDELCAALLQPEGPCAPTGDDGQAFEGSFNRVRCFRLTQSARRVLVGEASANLGYAGGINAWLLPLLRYEGWPGLWILNPDTVVAPDALRALAAHAGARKLGMVGGRIMASPTETRVINIGLRWRRLMGAGYAVGRGLQASVEPDPAVVEAQIQAASGASLYVTRPCAEALAPLDEKYFLYYEDIDWGIKARRAGFGIGYAPRSVVIHAGGSSIGSPSGESVGSPFAIYLEFRNSLRFVRIHYPLWFPWTAVMRIAHALRLLPKGRFMPAIRGLAAGLRGETGRPQIQLERERASRRRQPWLAARPIAVRIVKAAISAAWLAGLQARKLLRRKGSNLAILYYHAIRPEGLPMFRWQLSAIKAYGDAVSADYAGSPNGRPKIAITFDDGFQSVFDLAIPEMLKYAVPATVFVPTGCIGGAPAWDMEGICPDRNEILASAGTLRAAALAGVSFGAHTRTHPNLTEIAPELEREEIAGSKEDLERVLGKAVDLFSFPYGSFNGRTLQYCKEAGYRFVYSIVPSSVDLAKAEMLRPRIAADPTDTKLEFWLKLRGGYSWMRFASAAKSRFRGSASSFQVQEQRAESAAGFALQAPNSRASSPKRG